MSTAIQIILSAVSGAVTGALLFSLWFAGYMYVYIQRHGYYPFDLTGMGGTLENPILSASVTGAIIGAIQGLFTGILIGSLNISNLNKGFLIGFIAAEILILLFKVTNRGGNPFIALMAVFLQESRDILQYSLIWFLPSIITGVIVTKIASQFFDFDKLR